MFRRHLLPGLTLLLLLLLCLSCADRDDSEYLCSTCPEIDPAYAAAFEYIESHGEQIGLRPEVDGLLVYASTVDYLGRTNIRFHQQYRGVRVIGGEIVITLDTNLKVTRHFGRLIADVNISTRPQVTGATALSAAEVHFESQGFTPTLDRNGELVVYRHEDTDYLSWEYILRDDSVPEMIEYFVDANTAEIVHWASMIGRFH